MPAKNNVYNNQNILQKHNKTYSNKQERAAKPAPSNYK